jgi:hypothetical protein
MNSLVYIDSATHKIIYKRKFNIKECLIFVLTVVKN